MIHRSSGHAPPSTGEPTNRRRLLSLLAVALLAAGLTPGAGVPADAATPAYVPAGCNTPTVTPAGAMPEAHCFAMGYADKSGKLAVRAFAAGPPPTALGPADIQSAYELPATGDGMTVAIVDAYGYGSAEADLAVFRSHYGLPECTTDDGCFRKADQDGGTNYPDEDPDWSIETALDLDAVSSACPKCHLLLVQGNTSAIDDLGKSVDTAARLGANAISNSYGVDGEIPDESAFDAYYDHPGIAVTVSSGDRAVQAYPATSPVVTGVGGTLLTRDGSARGWNEIAWDEAGSGCSPYEPKPEFQAGVATGCDNRSSADIAADADPKSGLAVYNTLGQAGWAQWGGTSLASPLVAAMYALAGPATPGTYPVTYPYLRKAGLFDVTEGAAPGYDGPTGLGTPNGVVALTLGATGEVAGKVTDARSRAAIGDAAVTAVRDDGEKFFATTGADGSYDLHAPTGTYAVTASRFGYDAVSANGITVAADAVVHRNFAVTAQPTRTVYGRITDGSGHGWPLRARITIDGYPNGAIYSDAFTGAYSVSLPTGADYRLHVSAADLPGYLGQDVTVPVAGRDVKRNVAVKVDTGSCITPGYAPDCSLIPGGLVGGVVTDANSGTPLDGATVASTGNATEFGVTAAGDGHYLLFSSHPGRTTFTVTDGLYTDGRATVTVTPDAAREKDVALDAGHLTVDRSALALTTRLGAARSGTLVYRNDGRSPLHVHLGENEAPGTATTGAPLSLVKAATSTAADATGTDITGTDITGTGAPVPARGATPAAGPWSDVTDFPFSIMDNAVAAHDGKVYSIGGNTGVTKVSFGYAYDTVSGVWDQIPPLPVPMSGASAQFIGDTLYVVGGWGSDADSSTRLWTYQAGAAKWTEAAGLPSGTAAAGSAVVAGKLYVVAGCSTTQCFPITAAVNSYDPATNTWTREPDYPVATSFLSCGGVGGGVGGSVVCAGGNPGDGTGSPKTYAYRPGTGAWTAKADLPVDAWGSATAAANGRLEVMGGAVDGGATITNQGFAYDLSTDTWSALPNSNSATYRGGAACGIFKVGGSAGKFRATRFVENLPAYGDCGTDVSWLSENRTDFDIAAGRSVAVRVTGDSSAVSQPGSFAGLLSASTDTPYPTAAPVKVSLKVTPRR